MDDNSFENLAYLLDRGWGFGNVDERWKLVVELELLGEDREFLDDVVGAIEKSGTSLEFQLRVKALNLFEKNSGRMRVFEKLIVRPQNAAAFIANYELYGGNNKLLRIAAFLLRPGERLAISDFSEYVNDRKNLHTGDDVVGFSEKFVKEKFLGRRADWTKGDSLQEFWKLFPEFDFFKKVNEKNVLFLVFVYANIGADNNVSEEIKQLRVQVKDLLAANKDLALGVLNGVRDKVLVSEDKGMDDEKAMVGVLAEGTITNYKILERTTQYIKMICDMEQPESPNALVGMEERREIRAASSSLLVKFALKEKGSKRINYSNDDYASFYEKCMTVGQKELPDLLMSFDVLQVDKGNFAFMQREIMGAMAVINLLTAGKEGGFSEDLVDGLREVKLGLEKLKNTLGVDNDPAKQREILRKFHEGLQKFIKKIFSQTLGLQNLPELTQEMMDQVGPYLIYLSNIRDINDDKRGILSLFILLKLLGKWDEFKRGEDVKIDNYLTDSLKKRVHVYLKERKDLDIFDGKGERDPALSIDEKNKLNWMKTLAGRSEAILIGESRGILDTMQQIEGNYKGLLDPDNFSETEKALSAVVGEFGAKAVAGSLARRFKNAEFTDEIIGKLPLGAGVDEKEMVPAMQKMAGIFGALPSFVKAVEEAKLAEKIQSLEVALKPSEQVIAIFKKIGEEMSTASGARPVSEDVEHLRSVLHKKREELTAEEFSQAENYIDAVKLEVLGANNLRDELTAKFMVLHEASKKIELGTVFQSRMEEFRKVFIVDESESKVTLKSTMTGDLADVIPHIRQCLGCTTREFNNDTNLTFGDRNRFYLVVREFGMPESKSISDELVTVQMTVEGVSEGEEKKIVYSFVMDTVYDHTTRDVLVCNVLAVLKKLKELHRLSPDTAIDVFVTDAALKSCGVGQDYLKEKLTAEFGVVNIERIIKEVHIAQSASGDGHYEIGGGLGGRVSNRKGQVGGLKVWI